jgi:hypothetical protein
MEALGRAMVVVGILLTGVGLVVWWSGSRMPSELGLPGDLHLQRGNWTFFFPLTTCLVISLVLTLVLRLLNR